MRSKSIDAFVKIIFDQYNYQYKDLKKSRLYLKLSLGIFVFIPPKVTIEVINIGPKNHAKGILKYSANKAAGTDIAITQANSLDKICLKFSLLNGIAWLFCIIR